MYGLSTNPSVAEDSDVAALNSCCKLLLPVLEAVSESTLSPAASKPSVAPDEIRGLVPRLVVALNDLCGKEVSESQRDAMEGMVRNLEAAVANDIYPIFEAIDGPNAKEKPDSRQSHYSFDLINMNVDTCSCYQDALLRLKVCTRECCGKSSLGISSSVAQAESGFLDLFSRRFRLGRSSDQCQCDITRS